MQDTHRLAQMFARSKRPLLLRGPAGCGKRTLASHVHAWSQRSALTHLDCAGAQPSPALAQLREPGWLRRFDGTLLLIGVDALPPQLQHALATALDEPATCRVIATARTPGRVVGRLLHAFPQRLQVPGLGQRRDDVLHLARMVLAELAAPRAVRLSPTARRHLTQQDWSGNHSELQLLLRCAVDVAGNRGRVNFRCPTCDAPYVVPERYAGRSIRCRKGCTRVVQIPARDELVLEPKHLITARSDPRLAQAHARDWLQVVYPRVLRRIGRWSSGQRATQPQAAREALRIRVRERRSADAGLVLAALEDAFSAPRVEAPPPLPPHPALPALPPEPPRPLPAIPPRIEVVALELERYALDVVRRRQFPERRGWRRWVLACARQLRFTREGWTALNSAVVAFVGTVLLLAALCFGLGEQATRRAPTNPGAEEPASRAGLRTVQSWIRPLGQVESPWVLLLVGCGAAWLTLGVSDPRCAAPRSAE